MKKSFIFIVSTLAISTLFSCDDYGFNNEVIIVFTNDTHGQVNGKLSFANAGAIKQDLINKNKNVLLLDSGDIISGGFYTTYDQGQSMINFMEEAGYDAATLGNHEFDYGFDYLNKIVNNSKFPFISTNLYHMKDNVPTTRYTDLGSKTFTFKNNVKVGVLGVSTPESFTTSTPKHFQDEEGNYIYTFLEKNDEMYKVVQNEIDKLKKEDKCKYVVCMSHLGDERQGNQFTATKLAKNTSGLDVILDGHTHFADVGHNVKGKDNKNVYITQAGGTFSNIGKVTLSGLQSPKCELINETNLVNREIKNKETKLVKELDESLNIPIATSDIDFKKDKSYNGEYNIGDLCAEASYYYYNIYLPKIKKEKGVEPASLSFVNTGGIRAQINKGTWTKKSCREIHSFLNGVCQIKVKGSTLRKALEFSNYKLKDFFGGLQQVCGVTYNVNTEITSDIVVDGNNNYVSGPTEGHYRLSEINLFNPNTNSFEELEDDKEYIICGSSYPLLKGGDGMSMLVKEGTKIREEANLTDADILEIYLSNFKTDGNNGLPKISSANSPIALDNTYNKITINYDNYPYGSRINILP